MREPATTDFVTHAKRRSWFVALQAILALCGVVLVLAVRDETTYSRTTHFVLHPDSSVPPEQVPQAIDVLDGSLVQTVLRVLNSGDMLERSARAAHVADTAGISLDATVHAGSAYFDVTVHGDHRAAVDAISQAYTGAASGYVDRSYEGYDLETLGDSFATEHSFPPSLAVTTLSLLFGGLVGLGLVFVEWAAHSPPFAGGMSRGVASVAPMSVATPEEEAKSTAAAEARRTPAKRAARATGAAPKRSASGSPRARKSPSKAAAAPGTSKEGSTGSTPRKTRSPSTRATKTNADAAPSASADPVPAIDDAVNENPAGPAPSENGSAPERVVPPTPADTEEMPESGGDASVAMLDARRLNGDGHGNGTSSPDGDATTSSDVPAQ
jgi:hypothetical protein